jgi:hypothetical protein
MKEFSMRALRFLTFVILCAFALLAAVHAYPDTEETYSSAHSGWGAALGNCSLRVQTLGSEVLFSPVGHSNLKFLGTIPTAQNVNLAEPSIGVQGGQEGPVQVREKIKVYFTLKDGKVVPDHYVLDREYASSASSNKAAFEFQCFDLKPNSK